MKISNLVALQLLIIPSSNASDYPFELPETISAEININTHQQQKYNNNLLGTNIFNFTYSNEKELIRTFAPLTIRFPHGLWANWYDWRTDSTRQFGDDRVTFTNSLGETKSRLLDHLSTIQVFESSGSKVGIDGLQELNNERLNDQGQPFDMVWTFNMSADGEDGSSPLDDGSSESVDRYMDLIDRGFTVTNIEMGNENFYPGQRSTIIPNVSDYIARAQSMSKALKAINPNIQLSIPLLRKENYANPNYNELLTESKDYFDAVTVHTYVGYDPDDNNDSNEAYKTALLARVHIANSVNNYSRQVAPNKPIWLTEWGVKSGGPNAASILGMADTYIFMSENQDIYQRANWFSVNGKLNSFLVWHQKEVQPGVFRPSVKEPLEKTLFGSAHEIIRSVLQDSTLLDSDISAVELESGVKSISARAVIKDNKIVILALNLTDKASPFTLTLDNAAYNGNVTHYAMAFSSLDEERILPIDENPLNLVSDGNKNISLAPFSFNKIVLNDTNIIADVFDVKVTTESNKYRYDVGQSINLQASVSVNEGAIDSVQFFENGDLLASDSNAPYIFTWRPSTPGTHEIKVKAFKEDGTEKTSATTLVSLNGEPLVFDVSLAQPSTSEMTAGESLTLDASVSSNYGKVSKVDFHVNGNFVFSSTTPPYTFAWQPATAGEYTLDAVAAKSDGSIKQSESITITVNAPAPTPTPVQPAPPLTVADESSSSGGGVGLLVLLSLGIICFTRRSFYRNMKK